MTEVLGPEQEKYVKLVASMAIDQLMGAGCTPGAFVMNLRMIADDLERLNGNGKLKQSPREHRLTTALSLARPYVVVAKDRLEKRLASADADGYCDNDELAVGVAASLDAAREVADTIDAALKEGGA